jgi:hypothetical protein
MGGLADEELARQFCGEVMLNEAPPRPVSTRNHESLVGLSLLDLLLMPDHVDRATESLSFATALTLRRRMSVDITLDRLSKRRKARAQLLSRLMASEETRFALGDGPLTLWLPVAVLPRPVTEAVVVRDPSGRELARPPQRLVREALTWAILHLVAETLSTAAERPGDARTLMREDDRARSIVYDAIRQVCDTSPAHPRSLRRSREAELPPRATRTTHELLRYYAGRQTNDHFALALRCLALVLASPAIHEVIELVHRSYFIVVGAGDEPYQSLSFDLPDALATLRCRARGGIVSRYGRALLPWNQNYSATIAAPVAYRIGQYRLEIEGSARGNGRPETSVTMMAKATFSPPYESDAVANIATCVGMLRAKPDDEGCGTGPTDRYVAAVAYAGLGAAKSVFTERGASIRGLSAQWEHEKISARTATRLRSLADQIDAASSEIAALRNHAKALAATPTPLAAPDVAALGEGLDRVLSRLEPARRSRTSADRHFLTEEVATGQVARVRVNRQHHRANPDAAVTRLDLWVALTDDHSLYGVRHIIVSLLCVLAIWLVGALALDSATWFSWGLPWFLPESTFDAGRPKTLDNKSEAVVAVLLLVPGFALTLLKLPDRTSVLSPLRLAARAQAYCIAGLLGLWAAVIAATNSEDASEWSMIWVCRAGQWVLLVAAVWLAWSVWASALKRGFRLRAKGVSKELKYRGMRPDVEFDLSKQGLS